MKRFIDDGKVEQKSYKGGRPSVTTKKNLRKSKGACHKTLTVLVKLFLMQLVLKMYLKEQEIEFLKTWQNRDQQQNALL